jgi:nucleoid-associated protein YgaU
MSQTTSYSDTTGTVDTTIDTAASATATAETVASQSYTVANGDTLWDIAAAVAVAEAAVSIVVSTVPVVSE